MFIFAAAGFVLLFFCGGFLVVCFVWGFLGGTDIYHVIFLVCSGSERDKCFI